MIIIIIIITTRRQKQKEKFLLTKPLSNMFQQSQGYRMHRQVKNPLNDDFKQSDG